MTATEALERRIDELCSENERLRGQVASLTDRSIRMADKMDCLATENAKLRGARDVWQENDAKLRELVRDMFYAVHPVDREKFLTNMAELGVEVDG